MDYKNSFSTKLSTLRRENHLSLDALGKILGISNQAVSLLEKGKRSPSLKYSLPLQNILMFQLTGCWVVQTIQHLSQ